MLVWARIFWLVGRPIPKTYVRAISTRFSRGISTPAMRAICYPCRCLCLGLVQMTITVPWRRMTLQLSQRALTEALTFNGSSIVFVWWWRSLESVGDPAAGQVVRRQLDADPVTGQDPDEIHPEFAADMGEHTVAVLQFDREHRVAERFDHRPFDFDRVLLGHRLTCVPFSRTVSAQGGPTHERVAYQKSPFRATPVQTALRISGNLGRVSSVRMPGARVFSHPLHQTAVRISGPPSVMAIEFSKWAASEPSTVETVQSSARTWAR